MLLAFCLLAFPLQAQTSVLPDAPDDGRQAAGKAGSISGTVTDADGDAIAGATITLVLDGGRAAPRKVTADGDGYFSMLDVPAGNVTLTIASEGFATVTRAFALHGEETLETPNIKLPVATAAVDVEVTFSRHDVAEEDIKAEEKQRVAGFIPNFYVTYNWNAPPMNARQKFKLSVRGIVDPANFLISGIAAGIEQGTNAFPEYGQGAVGFGKRYGASLADGTVGSLLGGAVFPALLRQDPRYFYMGTGKVTTRALYALAAAFICRGDNGKWQPNYSSVLGDVATGAISNTYYPESSRTGWAETVEVGLLNALQQGVSNLMQEFVFKRISTGTRKPAKTKP